MQIKDIGVRYTMKVQAFITKQMSTLSQSTSFFFCHQILIHPLLLLFYVHTFLIGLRFFWFEVQIEIPTETWRP